MTIRLLEDSLSLISGSSYKVLFIFYIRHHLRCAVDCCQLYIAITQWNPLDYWPPLPTFVSEPSPSLLCWDRSILSSESLLLCVLFRYPVCATVFWVHRTTETAIPTNKYHFYRLCSWPDASSVCKPEKAMAISSKEYRWQSFLLCDHRNPQPCLPLHHRPWSREDLRKTAVY